MCALMCNIHSTGLCVPRKNSRGLLPRTAILALLCVSLATFANTAFAQEGTFIPTGSMSVARQFHTAAVFSIALLVCLARLAEDRRRWVSGLAPLLLICIAIFLSSCGGGSAGGGGSGGGGGGGNPGTPAGTYTLTVTGSFISGPTTLTHNTNLTVVVQ